MGLPTPYHFLDFCPPVASNSSSSPLEGFKLLYSFEDFVLDTEQRELRRGTQAIPVQPQVFDVLEYLLRHRGRVVSKDDLIAAVWDGRIVSDSALTTRINAVRTAIGDSGENQRLIKTFPRKGVRFVATVREQTEPAESIGAIEPAPNAAATVSAASPSDQVTERRQLTVASCELLVGAETGRMDPEDLHEIVKTFRSRIADMARRYDGLATNLVGNTGFIYFGYPLAHEDDAERAVRAGLDLIAAVNAVRSPVPLQARLGVATGPVVVGGPEGAAGEPNVVGDTPNLAARLHGFAEPNMVLVADSTRRFLGEFFKLQALGPQEVKGAAKPICAFRVLRPSSVESRFEALHSGNLTDLVGREEELELLSRRWTRAKTGSGQVVLLSGEPGIGKSRLTVALLDAIAAETHMRLRYFCSPQHTDSALYPIIGQMERAAGFAHDDAPKAKLDKLDRLLVQSSTSRDAAALIAETLSLPNDGRYPVLELTPEQRRQRTLDALVPQLQALARQAPVLMIFEDAHWIDPSSLELLGRMVDRIANLRVFLIVTFRPEFRPSWIERAHVTTMILNRLARREAGAIIDAIAGDEMLPSSVRQDIIERTDGIPLFVEEMTKAVLEAGGRNAAEQTAAAVPYAAASVPASLHASLMARLDRLGRPAKEVAQIGAAVGREFSHTLLAAVAAKPTPELELALDRLIAAGLVFRHGLPPHATYLFKHALVQDAAYGTLLREQRRALHGHIAHTLETRFPEVVDNQPELLARHCTEAGLIEKAAVCWGTAGQRSLDRSALIEAVEQLSRALAHIAIVPSTPSLRKEQIKLQVALVNALMHVKGYAAPETKTAVEEARIFIERAEELGEATEDPLMLFSVLYGFWVANVVAFNGDMMRGLAAEFMALAQKQEDTVPQMIGHRIMSNTLLFTGDIAGGLVHLDRANALYDPVQHRSLATRFGQEVGVSILSFRALTLWLLGYPESALTHVDRALRHAREIGQAATLMYALRLTSLTHAYCGNYEAARALTNELIELADEKGAVLWKPFGVAIQGCLFLLTGEPSRAVDLLISAIAAWRSAGATAWLPLYLSHLAQGHAQCGRFDDAWRGIEEALATMRATQERVLEAEVNRLAGEIVLMSPQPDRSKATAYFECALAIARAQQAKSWELRAAMSMARLWHDQGKRQQARELLTPVYAWFIEGFETRDLQQARSLLVELS